MNDPAPLQFDRAELPQAPSAVSCAFCKRTPLSSYYSVNQKTACESCSAGVTAYLGRRPDANAWLLALGMGLGAGAVAAFAYAASIHFTGYNLGLVSIGVGWLVGRAVRKGAAGGRPQQILAVALTYLSVSSALVARVLWDLGARTVAWDKLLPVLITAPFRLVGFPIGTLIVGFGLYEAWRVTRAPVIQITGPHPVVAAPASVPASHDWAL